MKQTPSQTVGPFLHIGLIYSAAHTNLVQEQTTGERIKITGLVLDGNGEPVNDALVEIWQPGANGIYNHPADPLHAQADPHFHGFGRCDTRNGGVYEFMTIKPGSRNEQAPFVNMYVFARGMLNHVMTRVYFGDEPANVDDPVLNAVAGPRRETLIAHSEPAYGLPTYRFDIHLQGEQETVFFDFD